MEIREATASDIPAIVLSDELGNKPERLAFIKKSVTSQALSVALIDNHIVGYVVIEYNFFESGFLTLLIVKEANRRQGIGSALMQHAESTCKTEKLFSSINQSNLIAQRLLERLGFSRSGQVDNLDDGDLELIYFKKLS